MTKKPTSLIKKTKARIIAITTAGGIIISTMLGLNAFKDYRPSHNQTDTTTDKIFETTSSTTATTIDRDPHPIVTEPSIATSPIETTPYYTTPAETTAATTTGRPEATETTMTYVTEPPIEVEDGENQLDVEIIDILAKFTNKVKEFIQNSSKSEPTISVTGIESMKIDGIRGIITSNLQITTNAGKSYYAVVQFSNNNSNFEIYNMTSDITKDEFVTNLDEYLSDVNTSCTSFKAQSRFQVKNEETISNIINARINSSNATSQEIAHLKNVLKNPSEVNLLVSLKKSTKIDNKYQYEFSATLNTDKYCLILDVSLTSNYKLTENTLRQEFENIDFDYCNINSLPTLFVHETIYIINDRANELELEQGLTK